MYFQGQREYTFSGPKRKWCWYPYNITSFQLDVLCIIADLKVSRWKVLQARCRGNG